MQETDRAGGLLGGDHADQHHTQCQANDRTAAQPVGHQQRVAPVVLDGQASEDQGDRCRQCHADPRRLQPPFDAPQRQRGAEQGGAAGHQGEGQEIQGLERLEAVTWRKLEHQYAPQRCQCQPQFEQVQATPFGDLQQVFGKDPRQRQRQLRGAQAQHHRLQPPLRGKRLDHVVQPQRAERCPDHAVGRTHGDGRIEVVDQQVGEGDQGIQHQEHFGERAQAELLAELHQQQVDGHVGHDVGGR
ncbi:hypothetical protein D3C81_1402820 [compost metagenome]